MKSQSSGCTERVAMSMLSWRSLRSSAQAIAPMPSPRRRTLTSHCSSGSAHPAREATCSPSIAEAPSFLFERMTGGEREDVVEVVRLELLAQLARRSLRGERSEIHDRDAVAVAVGLLHLVRRHEDRRAGLVAQLLEPLPDEPTRGRVETHGRLVKEEDGGPVQQSGRDLEAAEHAAREVAT